MAVADGGRYALVPDDSGDGVTLEVDGTPQSHVDPGDPTRLEFAYVAHLAAVLDLLPPGPLPVTHVGGGGLTLPRYVQAKRPGSPQVVLEPDATLTDLVRRALPLPRGHRIRVRPVDGRTGTAALADVSAAALVLDAYADGRVPAELGTVEYLADVRRVLRPDGLMLANLADEPGLRYVVRVVAGARAAVGDVALVAATEVAKGRRFGNVVLIAGADLPVAGLRRRAASMPLPTTVLHGEALRRRLGHARPFADDDAQRSPEPPDARVWRLR